MNGLLIQWGVTASLNDNSIYIPILDYTNTNTYIVVACAKSAGTDSGAYDRGAFYIKPYSSSKLIAGAGRGPTEGAQWMTIGY